MCVRDPIVVVVRVTVLKLEADEARIGTANFRLHCVGVEVVPTRSARSLVGASIAALVTAAATTSGLRCLKKDTPSRSAAAVPKTA